MMIASNEEQLKHLHQVTELMEAGIMHNFTNNFDTTAESIERN